MGNIENRKKEFYKRELEQLGAYLTESVLNGAMLDILKEASTEVLELLRDGCNKQLDESIK